MINKNIFFCCSHSLGKQTVLGFSLIVLDTVTGQGVCLAACLRTVEQLVSIFIGVVK